MCVGIYFPSSPLVISGRIHHRRVDVEAILRITGSPEGSVEGIVFPPMFCAATPVDANSR